MSRERRRVVHACFVLIASAAGYAAAQPTASGEAPARPAAVPATAATATAAPAAAAVADKRAGPPPGAPAPMETAPAATAAADPGRARLVIATNAACVLRIGGVVQEQVMLLPDAPRTVAVLPGEVAIECASTTVPEAIVKLAKPVEAGGELSVALDVADLVVKASCAGKPATLADLGHGVLRHCVTGMDWTQADNGVDVDREAAGAWCAKQGGAWELPTANALAELIDRSGRSSTRCGRDTCYVSPHFRLSAPTYWSKDPVGIEAAMLVHLLLGGRHPALLHVSRGYRALCLRQP